MKRWVIIILFTYFSIVALGLVSSADISDITCTDPDQILFRASDEQNAHVELWNGSAYSLGICYGGFFGSDYDTGGENPHLCDGENNVSKFSSETNAHAEAPDGTVYTTNVCYGDLKCVLATVPCDETDIGDQYKRECRIGFLSDVANAHVRFGVGGVGKQYPYQLCCESASGNCVCDYDGTCDGNENLYNCQDCDPVCGDGVLEGGEECDYGMYCEDGTTSCFSDEECVGIDDELCKTRNISECNADCTSPDGGAYCGDSVKNLGEDCDGSDLGNATSCQDIGFTEGTLSCENCHYTGCSGEEDLCELFGTWFSYTDANGDDRGIGNCDDNNKIEDAPHDFSGDLNEFRKLACGCTSGDAASPAWNGGGNATSGYCAWNATNNECKFYGVYNGATCSVTYTSDDGACDNGEPFKTVDITYTLISGTGSCPADTTTQIPCSRLVQLPFFGAISFVLSLIIIALIYVFYIKRKK